MSTTHLSLRHEKKQCVDSFFLHRHGSSAGYMTFLQGLALAKVSPLDTTGSCGLLGEWTGDVVGGPSFVFRQRYAKLTFCTVGVATYVVRRQHLLLLE